MNDIFIHNLSDVSTKKIGNGTKIWQFCVVLSGASIGSNVNICSNCFIENDVNIGDNVTIKNGVMIYDGVSIQDNVFIGSNVSFTNDKFPRSKNRSAKFFKTTIEQGASIGAGSVILPGIVIGKNAFIGAGSVVTKNIESNTVYYGNPAKFISYL